MRAVERLYQETGGRGAYVVRDCAGVPDLVLIASGSEVNMALAARAKLSDRKIRVVSMLSCGLFLSQNKTFQKFILPEGVKRVVIEAGVASGLISRVQNILKKSNVDSVLFDEVSPNLRHYEIDAGVRVGLTNSCDIVVGLGGGSSIDAAKGIALSLGHNKPVWDFCDTQINAGITNRVLPVIAVPLWTEDKRLMKAATELDLKYKKRR